jgi:hypothetical protein
MSSELQNTRVLILQRDSLVAPGVPSLSVSARVTEVLDYLEDSGGIEHFSVSENDARATQAVAWADVIVLSKHRSIKALELVRLARSRRKALIYDVDDWIFSFPSYSGGRTEVAGNHTMAIISQCNYVTVANHELMQRLPEVIPEARLVFLPNGMWVERYGRRLEAYEDDVDSGSGRIVFTNADFLKVHESKEAILSALNVFFIRHPDCVLDFYGDPFPEMFSLPFLHFTNRMPYQEYMRALLAGNYMFAITPLGAEEDADSAGFNACKNPFKYINYGVAGIPGIYSSATIYQNCIQHGVTGLLVDNTYEAWLSAMEQYASDVSLRKRVRDAAKIHVTKDYHVKVGAQILSGLIAELVVGRDKDIAMSPVAND